MVKKKYRKASKVRFVVYYNDRQVFVTTPKLEKKMLKMHFGTDRRVAADNDKVPKKYWVSDDDEDDSAKGISIFDREEYGGLDVLIEPTLTFLGG